jgi:integrase
MPTEPTARVIVRHGLSCPDRKKGLYHRKCDCRKSLLLYDGTTRKNGKLTNRIVSAKTRSWSRAEKAAQDWLDSFDPEKQELKQLRAAKELQQIRLEEAVAVYCADFIRRRGNNGTVRMMRSLLGHVDPETKQVKRSGHFFSWLGKQVPRPVFLADITPAHLTAWRSSWTFNDTTAVNRWAIVKGFFRFCETQGWIADEPTRKLGNLRIAPGSRTVPFTDEQYTRILAAVSDYDPKNAPAVTRQNWQHRLLAFLELMRWSGADLIDAVRYAPSLIDAEGVLRYRRQKTGILATIPLPEHVVALLRNLPLERDSVGPDEPFRQKGVDAPLDAGVWNHRLKKLFSLAGITRVQTDHRTREPHSKMLRDTFAVWHLRHGASLHTVAKMLGHSRTATTEKAYLPWVKELEQAHIADARESLKHLPKPKTAPKVAVIRGSK